MRSEYLPEGSADCPILKLSHFDEAEATNLRALCLEMASGKGETQVLRMAVRGDLSVERIIFRLGVNDRGVSKLDAPSEFEWVLSAPGWTAAAGLVEPFCGRVETGYQWLDEHSEISLLLTPGGNW